MKLTPNFWLSEFERSGMAARRGIDNSVPVDLLDNVMLAAQMLQRIRGFLSDMAGQDVPIHITSGYRAPALNAAVGGSPRSDHMQALAADWIAPVIGPPSMIVRLLLPHLDALGIGQIIDEFPAGGRGWVHTSVKVPDNPINRALVIDQHGVRPFVA